MKPTTKVRNKVRVNSVRIDVVSIKDEELENIAGGLAPRKDIVSGCGVLNAINRYGL